MAIGRHLVIETKEAVARMGKSVLTERIIYPVSFSTLNPQPSVMSTSFAEKISKKVSNFPGALFPLAQMTPRALQVSGQQWDRSLPPGCRMRAHGMLALIGSIEDRTEMDRDDEKLRRTPQKQVLNSGWGALTAPVVQGEDHNRPGAWPSLWKWRRHRPFS